MVVLLRGIAALAGHAVLQWHSAGLEVDATHRRRIKPSALRSATVEASMKRTLSVAHELASDHAAPHHAPLRSSPDNRYAGEFGQCKRLSWWGA
jgi:hypothetical protein